MKAVADQYLNALRGLESSEARDGMKLFSSVSGELKTSGFGPDYWVQNLVSTVRFPDALMASCEPASDSRAAPHVFLEVEPHLSFAGPAKQTLVSEPNKVDHKYVSALVRGKDAYTTVLTLAGKLFKFSLDVDIEAVNDMSGGAKTRNMLLDLPPYTWDYSNRYWHESRSSFLTMAMEAARQLNDQRGASRIKRFHLKKVQYFKAIVIPESPAKVEVMISLSAPTSRAATPHDSSGWESFQITSSANAETWSLSCVGQIRLEYDSVPNDVDGGREELQALSNLRNHLSQTDAACTQPIEHGALYQKMRRNGIDYGTNFATIKELRIGEC